MLISVRPSVTLLCRLRAMETHNILHPEFITGGEAIAEQLEKPTCQLRVLDLSWNGLRQSSATALGRALQANNSLVELDVQYNALGQEGVGRPVMPAPLCLGSAPAMA